MYYIIVIHMKSPTKDDIDIIIAGRIRELELKYGVTVVYNVYTTDDEQNMQTVYDKMDKAKREYFEREL